MNPHLKRFNVAGAILVCILANTAICQTSRQELFTKITEEMRSIITNKSSTDEDLLQAISHLGRVTEPVEFWTGIANDTGYPISHRRKAIFALFRRFCFADTLKSLSLKLKPANWLRDDDISEWGKDAQMGPVPMIDVKPGEHVFVVKVLDGANIYLRIAGEIGREDFSRALRGERINWSKQGSDGVILQCAYSDDYESWLKESHVSR